MNTLNRRISLAMLVTVAAALSASTSEGAALVVPEPPPPPPPRPHPFPVERFAPVTAPPRQRQRPRHLQYLGNRCVGWVDGCAGCDDRSCRYHGPMLRKMDRRAARAKR